MLLWSYQRSTFRELVGYARVYSSAYPVVWIKKSVADINSETRVPRARGWKSGKGSGRETEWGEESESEREGIIRNEGESEGNEREESIGQGCIHLAPPQVTPTCAIPSVGRHAYACGTNTRRTYGVRIHTRALHLRRRASSTYTRTRVCAGRAGRCAGARSEHAKPTPTTASTIRTHTHRRQTRPIDYCRRRRHHRRAAPRRAASDSYREHRLLLLAQLEASRGARVSRVCGSGHPVTRSRNAPETLCACATADAGIRFSNTSDGRTVPAPKSPRRRGERSGDLRVKW